MKIMLDTNILISALIFKSTTMDKLITGIIENHHEIVVCTYVINEFKKVAVSKFGIDSIILNTFFTKISIYIGIFSNAY